MTELAKAKIITDIKKNRLYITLPNKVRSRELEYIYTEIRFGAADLKPGFDVITDLSRCSLGYLSAIPILGKITCYLATQKAGRVIRVTGNMNLILKQLIAHSSKYQCYKPIYVATLEEAEEELKKPIAPGGIRFQLHNRPLKYQVNDEQIEGHIIDISTCECTIKGKTENLSAGMELSVVFELGKKEGGFSPYTLQVLITGVNQDTFTLKFLNMDEQMEQQLYEGLTHEMSHKM